MDKIKYSIVTPNYNSFHLMKKYFEALQAQTYKKFEVIVIDDASTDDSYNQLLQYKKNCNLNLTVLKNEKNSGPGVARNYGMKEAKGEWITFIDNDDWVEDNLLEKVNDIIQKNNLDCVIYDYYIDSGKKTITAHSVYSKNEGIISVSDAVAYTRNHSVCKFYKTNILKQNNIYFPTIKRHEDIAFVARAISKCKNIYYLKVPFYHYMQRRGSLSSNKQLDEATLSQAFSILEQDLLKSFPNELAEKSVSDLLYGTCIIMCKAGKSKQEIKKFIDQYEQKYPMWWATKMTSLLGKTKKVFLYATKKRYIGIMKLIAKLHSIIIGG